MFHQGKNSPPEVSISLIEKKNTFPWNSMVPYSISVSDAEDGKTAFNEILPSEVLLEVKYLSDSSHTKKYLSSRSELDRAVLVKMSTASCFNCHATKAKVIGPSFEQIASRYKSGSVSIDSISKNIIVGTTGRWSDLKMPPHPDLKVREVKEMVAWILKNGTDTDVDYFVGIEGAFSTREKPKNVTGREVYVLIATYLDEGMKNEKTSGDPNKMSGRQLGQRILQLKNAE